MLRIFFDGGGKRIAINPTARWKAAWRKSGCDYSGTGGRIDISQGLVEGTGLWEG